MSSKRTNTTPSPSLATPYSSLPLRSLAPLLLPLLASFIIYLLLAFWFPLLPHYRQVPPADIRTFAPTLFGGLLYGLLLILLFVLHLWLCRALGRLTRPPRLLGVLLIAILFSLPLLLTYPINATDVYRYVIHGRISSVYGESTYTSPPEAFTDDPFLPLAGEWAGETSPYGPIWEGVAAGVTAISGDNLLLGILLFKLLGLAFFLGAAVLLWNLLPAYLSYENRPQTSMSRTTVRPSPTTDGRPQKRHFHSSWWAAAHVNTPENRNHYRDLPSYTALWVWNPFLLLIFVANAHNDALMLFWLLLGLWITRRGRRTGGFLIMTLAPLTKAIALLALPFFFLAIWKEMASGRERVRFTLLSVAGTLAMALIAFAPWSAMTSGNVLSPTLSLVTRLMREAEAGASFSPATLLWFGGRLLPGQPLTLTIIGRVAQILFVLFFLWLLWRTWRGRPAERSTAESFIAYLLQALNFRIWYAAWPFPWWLLEGMKRPYWLRTGLCFLLTSQLSVIIYGHIRLYLLGGDHAYAHLIGIPFTFLLPLILARFLTTRFFLTVE